MTSLLWSCLLFGGGVVVLQFAASLLGLHHDAPHASPGHGALGEGLQLFSIRALSAGLAFFGVGGLAGLRLGLPNVVAVLIGAATGAAAMVGVALLMRAMGRLGSDQTFRLANAVGKSGVVYLSIPGKRTGTGKIHITIQERLVELDAITPEDEILTGAQVLVIDSVAPATVIVVPQPQLLEEGEPDA